MVVVGLALGCGCEPSTGSFSVARVTSDAGVVVWAGVEPAPRSR
jgi:hypothetical protein